MLVSKTPDRTALWLGGVLAVAVAVRLVVCFGLGPPAPNADSADYIRMAEGILSGAPVSDFPNGFPLIIAALRWAVGPERLVDALLGLNVVLSTGIVFGTWLLGRSLLDGGGLDRRLALAAAALAALWPNQLNLVRQLMSEVPATFFLTFALVLTVRAPSLAAGLLYAAASLVRSTLAPIGPLQAAGLWLTGRRRAALWLLAGAVAGVVVEAALVRLGIIARDGNLAVNLMAAISGSSIDGIDFRMLRLTPGQTAAPLAAYLDFARAHPAAFLWQRVASLWELWGPWPNPGDPEALRSTVARLAIALRFPLLLLLALAALWIERRRVAVWQVALPILAVTAVHTMFFSTARYTFTVEPEAIVLAVLGAARLYSSAANLRRTSGASRSPQA